MIGGQTIDMNRKRRHCVKTIRKRLIELKTARLFEASTKLGAMAARSSNKKINAMAAFGKLIGMAFQIVDDIIDGEEAAGSTGRFSDPCLAEKLTDTAKNTLKIFGDKANALKEIADLLVKRRT
jgi:geranylgeranyl pyrophosphate synthase